MSWVFDRDSSDSKGRPQWMVYDESEPETTPVIARGVRSEALARLLAAVPKMHAALVEVKRNWHAMDGSEKQAFQLLKDALASAGDLSLDEIQKARGEAKLAIGMLP